MSGRGGSFSLKARHFYPWLTFMLILTSFLHAACSGPLGLPGDDSNFERPPGLIFPPAPDPRPDPGDQRLGMLFYPDAADRFLVPVQQVIPWTEGIARQTLSLLTPSSARLEDLNDLGLKPALPGGTEISGLSINEGLARVDFNSTFLDYPAESERLVLGSILCTLRQFPSIERVEIMVDGEYIDKFPGGAPGRLPLGPECWVNVELDSEVEDYRDFTAVKLYYCFATPRGWIFYVPVIRILLPQEDENMAAVRELIKGPRQGSGLFSDIPPDTVLRSFNIAEDGLAVLDLSVDALNYRGGRTGSENLVNQILLTVSSFPGVEEVQILIEGEKVTLREGLDLTEPLTAPPVYNYF